MSFQLKGKKISGFLFFFNKSFPVLWQKSIKSAGGKYLYFGGRPVLFNCKEAHQWKNYALDGWDDAVTPQSTTCPTSEHNTLACETIVKKTAGVLSREKSKQSHAAGTSLQKSHVCCMYNPAVPSPVCPVTWCRHTEHVCKDTATRVIPPDLERILARMLHFIFSDNIPDPVWPSKRIKSPRVPKRTQRTHHHHKCTLINTRFTKQQAIKKKWNLVCINLVLVYAERGRQLEEVKSGAGVCGVQLFQV